MATASEDLTALDSTLVLNVPTDRVAVAGIQMKSGAGTLVLEATIDGTNWKAVQMDVPGTIGGAGVANISAVGDIGYADVSYAEQVRVRKSVGAASCVAVLTVTMP